MVLKTSTRYVGDALVIDCGGRIICGEESAFLNHKVRDLLREHNRIVINLSGVTYIDSSGLGTLVGLHSTADRAGAQIKLAGLLGKVKDLMQITKLLTVFENYDTVDEAVADVKRAA